jgi:hypothetical protein
MTCNKGTYVNVGEPVCSIKDNGIDRRAKPRKSKRHSGSQKCHSTDEAW